MRAAWSTPPRRHGQPILPMDAKPRPAPPPDPVAAAHPADVRAWQAFNGACTIIALGLLLILAGLVMVTAR